MSWQPSLGALVEGDGVRFRVWAPIARSVEVVIEGSGVRQALARADDGTFSGRIAGVGPGTRYRYRVDGGGPFPDPASRYQPDGVHGPSQVTDAGQFPWTDEGWAGHRLDELVVYELHVGTFTPEGTFEGATRRLELLRDLGVTAVELMPVADFPGQRNWGYDGVSLFAPARCYGTPDDLRRFVDVAHRLGLSVILDVVYNHFGPDGNYTGAFSPQYLSRSHSNPWGRSLNFDAPGSEHVRAFFIENAIYWLREFHFDGLRLDATHAIVDQSERQFLAELAHRVREDVPGRRRWLIAEDHRNLAAMYDLVERGGWGLDGVWADDFHHEMRRLLAGDDDGYYRDYRGRVDDLATILNRGWLYCGQLTHLQTPRGTDPSGLAPEQFVICLQNHDQIGNRAFGERLHHQIEPAVYRAASAVLLTVPQTPLLFMGQEWAASTPFRFFTDHKPDLGRKVTQGRRNEFKQFKAFSDPQMREKIPDPQALETYQSSKLQWQEREESLHAGILALYTRLLELRRTQPALRAPSRRSFQALAWDDATLLMRFDAQDGSALLLVARLKGAGRWSGGEHPLVQATEWVPLLHTEEERFAVNGRPLKIDTAAGRLEIEFEGPAAVLFHLRPSSL